MLNRAADALEAYTDRVEILPISKHSGGIVELLQCLSAMEKRSVVVDELVFDLGEVCDEISLVFHHR